MKILAVCLGNICRSPLAEGILRHHLDDSFEIDSAGTSGYHKGSTPDERSIEIAKKNGIDISQQKSRSIQESDLEYFDRIYVMDYANREMVLGMTQNPLLKEKVKLILEEDPEATAKVVPDPYYGAKEDFQEVYDMIDKAVLALKSSFN